MTARPNHPEEMGRTYSWHVATKAGAWWMMIVFATDAPGQYLIARHKEWPFLLHIVIAALPLVASALYVRGIVKFVRGMDELYRAIGIAAFTFAVVTYLFLMAAWSTLERAGVFAAAFQWTHLDALERSPFGNCTFAICMTYILFGLGYTHIFNRRYQ